MTSKIKRENLVVLKRVAKDLYDGGKTLREVAETIHRSHTWVWLAIKEADSIGKSKTT